MLDASLDYAKNNCDEMRVCSSDVMTTGEPDITKIQGASALTGAIGMALGDFTYADGDVSGRKATVAAKNNQNITASGDAEHVVLIDSTGPEVLYITTCTLQTLTNGNQVSIPAWDIEFRDPA
jgi:hypothetical protein